MGRSTDNRKASLKKHNSGELSISPDGVKVGGCLNHSYSAAGIQGVGMCLPLWQELVRADCQKEPSLGAEPPSGGQPKCFGPSHRGPKALLFGHCQFALLSIISHCHLPPSPSSYQGSTGKMSSAL